MKESFKKRIGYEGELKPISSQICKDYDLGEFKSDQIVLQGYEDFNFILETTKGKYFVKVFSNFRSLDDCKRYTKIMERAMESDVSTPNLHKSDQGYLHVINVAETELRLSVAEFIDGKNIYELKHDLNIGEIKFLAHQAALINSIDIKPRFIYDSWAITNFIKEFEEKSTCLTEKDLELINPLVKKFNELKINDLPHCFVHGDIIATNVMKDINEKLWIIDFSVSNYYPRIQELAVLACNLLFNEEDKTISEGNFNNALEEYQKTVKLTQRELDSLPVYIELAHGMHLLRANFEKVNNNQSQENEYWLNQGKTGLKQMLE